MTIAPWRGRWARGRAVVVPCVALVLVLGACTGDGSDGAGDEEAAAETVPASDEWVAAVDDPCTLVEIDEIAAAFGVERVALLPEPEARACSFLVEPNGTLTVALHQPQAAETSENRTAGALEVRDSENTELVLLRPGASIFARNGRALAQISIRFATDTFSVTPRLVEQLDEVATAVRDRLPEAPTPGEGIDERDLCDLAPVAELGKGFTAGEPATTFSCAYVAQDTTIVRFGWKSAADEVPSGSLLLPGSGQESEVWEGAGEGATWVGAEISDGSGGSGRGEVAVDAEHTLVVEVSSPNRPVDELQELATAVAASVQAEVGG